MASQDWLDKDFYAVLGVSKDISDADLKKEYRKLARKYHPDANQGDAKAEAKFKEISEAYSVLSDPKERKEYDSLRAMGAGARFSAGSGGPGGQAGFEDLFGGLFNQGGGGGGQRVRFSTGGAPGGGGYEDLFGGLFGQAGGPAGFSRATAGEDVEARARLSFEQAVNGATVSLGTPQGKTVKTKIPAGVHDGQKIRLRGKGNPGRGGGPAGDLIVHISVGTHPVFTREGDNLRVVLPVTFAEATLGATVEVPTFGGGRVKVKVKPGTPSGRVLRIKGRGVKTAKRTGDLLAEVQVVVPTSLKPKAREALDEFVKAVAEDDPRAELFERAGE